MQQSYGCHGGRNQGFWYDEQNHTLHSELSHDRCLDVKGGTVAAGERVQIYDCHGGDNLRLAFNKPVVLPADTAAGQLRIEQPPAVVFRIA